MIFMRNKSANTDIVFRIENGKWVSGPAKTFGRWRDNAGVLMSQGGNDDGDDGGGSDKRSTEVTRLWDQDHMRVVNLGHVIDKLDKDYLRDTGTMIYTTKSKGKGNSVINIVRTTIHRPDVSNTGK